MQKVVIALALLVCLAFAASPAELLANGISKLSAEKRSTDVWAVLCAGSNGWSNYRHQADVYHMYQVLHQAGVPDDHIITMFYDDIASSPSNPTPGIVINVPNGTDVYAGVPKDYTRENITVDNFLKVLTGEQTNAGTGRVLNSGPNSHVFVYFDDHGNRDIVGFPNGRMNSAQLNKANWIMYQKGMYGTLIQYISACYSGSMFYAVELPPNTYVATAAPVLASGYATAYDSLRRTYLASAFPFATITSMERSMDMTFQEHFDYINTQVANLSLPCQYGDMSLAQGSVAAFFEAEEKPRRSVDVSVQLKDALKDAVPQYAVPYELAKKLYAAEPSKETHAELQRQTDIRRTVDGLGDAIAKAMLGQVAADGMMSVPPCTVCDRSCTCYQNCDEGPELCKFECCDSRACQYDHVPTDAPRTALTKKIRAAHKCTDQLVEAVRNTCGLEHPYVASLEVPIARLCRRSKANVQAALEVISSKCPSIAPLLN